MNRRGPAVPFGTPQPGGGRTPPAGGAPAFDKAIAPQRGTIAPPPVIPWEGRLQRTEELIEQFRVDIERFWNGALAIPPEELRTKIQRELRELRGVSIRGALDQFRLGNVEARFNTLSELFGRRLREREEGRGSAPARVVQEKDAKPRHDPRAGIVFRGEPDAVAVEALWSGLIASGGGARIELDTFRGYITRQLGEIRVKTGAAAVQFRVVQEEGKLKLKAKPVGEREAG